MSQPLILFHRDGCHLCEQMLTEIRGLYGEDLPITLVNVDADAGLRARYGEQVPVLVGGSRILASGRLDPAKLEEYLEGQ